ncbi:MAG TPA: ABC transporter permease [Tessaracoccus flavescens]|uniref:Transport permease protein n=1 Tax=Tessaracoccus flavescens TaxID=399497 RepID=A0A921JQH4_9ACTN|nr:ABC transporter permease [Tessaracoccus flavescens]
MTTLPYTATTTTTRAAKRPARWLHYFRASLGQILRDWAFISFILVMPVTMYLFFSAIYGDQEAAGGVTVAAVMMVTMATYGGLGAAMNAGASIQSERSSGWFRQLMITPLRPAEFITAKLATAVAVVLPAIVVVFIAGMLRGVRLPIGTWFATLGMLMAALVPMVILGLVIGLWFKPQTAAAVTTLTMLALSMIGGLWFPLDMMPGVMQFIGKLTPSYWAGQLGVWPVVGGDFPWQGVLVIGIWTLALAGLGALGYGRAVRNSRR